MISNTFHLEAALTWYDQGFCVMPARFDGSKRPRFEWKESQGSRPDRERVASWYRHEPELGVGLICGNVSGGLEMLELEGRATSSEHMDKIRAECDAVNITWLWDILTLDGYAEWTPSGGIHLLYRISDHDIPGNTKIAMTSGKLTLAETRGEGGFVIVAPTSGTVHQTGEAWTLAAGEIGHVPVISWNDRELLHAAIKTAIDERPAYVAPVVERRPLRERAVGEISPQDDFNERGDWHDILTSRGWTHHSRTSSQEFWTRPGKDPRDGHSAATGHQGSPNLYVWSGMDEERHYSKAQFIAYSDFNGDFAATTKFLARQGFGTPLPARSFDVTYPNPFSPEVNVQIGTEVLDFDKTVAAAQTTEVAAPAKRPKIRQFTEKGFGPVMHALCGDQFRYVAESKDWRTYTKGLWSEDHGYTIMGGAHKTSDYIDVEADRILAAARKQFEDMPNDITKAEVKAAEGLIRTARSVATDRGLKAVINQFRAQPDISVSSKHFDANMDILVFTNGTYELNTGTFREHRPSDMSTKGLGYAYDPKASAPQFERMISQILPDVATRDFLQRSLGYTLTGDADQGAWFIWHGRTGCGKSTMNSIVTAAFGDHGITAASGTFRAKYNESGPSNDLNDLLGARFISTSETSKHTKIDEELMKRFTGGDAIRSRGLYEKNREWRPSGVVTMLTNHKPILDAEDSATWRRVKLIHFPESFYREGGPAPDTGLTARIVDSELSGVMNWILAGLASYRQIGLDVPEVVKQEIADYRAESDVVSQFITENSVSDGPLIVDEKQSMSGQELWRMFTAWCVDNKAPSGKINAFWSRLDTLGYTSSKDKEGIRARRGIGIRPGTMLAASQTPRTAWSPGFRN